MPQPEKSYVFLPNGGELTATHASVRSLLRIRYVALSACAFLLSIGLNLYLGLPSVFNFRRSYDVVHEPPTPFAGLYRDNPVPWTHVTEYSIDKESSNDLWEAINIDNGVVALPDDFVRERQLHEAQRFPWDTGKGLFVLNGFHNLHCLKLVHNSLMSYRQGTKQLRPFGHILHCLDALRQDVICDADDTPRYTTSTDDKRTGEGQVRQCRDWSKLETWAQSQTACFRYINETDDLFPNIERFRFCPAGSPYRQAAEIDDPFTANGNHLLLGSVL